MQYSDINRERKTNIKNGWHTDKAIIGGVKKVASAIKNTPKRINNRVDKFYDKVVDRGVDKIMKSKWWNS